jgi:hypothetical protein
MKTWRQVASRIRIVFHLTWMTTSGSGSYVPGLPDNFAGLFLIFRRFFGC